MSEWRDRVLAAAESALKARDRDERDAEIDRLKAKVGEITMDNELLDEKIARLERGRLFVPQEVEEMSRADSPSGDQFYGVARICAVWGIARATVYRHRVAEDAAKPAGGAGL